MSKKNTREAKARRRAEREQWRVTEEPGFYSAVRDDGLGVTVQEVTPEMLRSLGPGHDVFDMMRDNCPCCNGTCDDG